MTLQHPTRIYRIVHIDNLKILLNRKGLFAPSEEPSDGEIYKVIHDVEIQKKRRIKEIFCGPKGCLHDYVPFYFGTLSPMLLKLHTGKVNGYEDGQAPLIYLVSHAQNFKNQEFVFSDGHGINSFTKWYEDLKDLDKIDWFMVNQKIWRDSMEDNDRQRRKQAEFLIYKFCPWFQIRGIVVINEMMENKVKEIMSCYSADLQKPVKILKTWYY